MTRTETDGDRDRQRDRERTGRNRERQGGGEQRDSEPGRDGSDWEVLARGRIRDEEIGIETVRRRDRLRETERDRDGDREA